MTTGDRAQRRPCEPDCSRVKQVHWHVELRLSPPLRGKETRGRWPCTGDFPYLAQTPASDVGPCVLHVCCMLKHRKRAFVPPCV